MRDFSAPGRSPVYAANAAVATSHPLSTLAAIEVLRAGGNAVDAGIAAVAVQCVVDPLMTGIGGDCFALYAPAGATKPIALDGSGRAPAAATPDWYAEHGVAITPTSPHAVTVPGAVAAWDLLVREHGTRSLGELLQPAIRYAEDGFVVQQRVGWDWLRGAERVAADPHAAATYLAGGEVPAIGSVVRLPKLAATLRAIAEAGARAFYEGPVAEDMVSRLNALGGLHTLDDFAAARPDVVAPVSTRYRGYDVYECPPAGQGLAALMMLNVLSHYDVGALSDLDRLHLFAEVCKQGYHHRDVLFGDAALANVPVEHLLSDAWKAAAHGAIDMGRAREPEIYPEIAREMAEGRAHKDTVYLCVVDRDGNALSLINSIFQGFGSGILAPESGVLLHNRGLSFRTEGGHPNSVGPGKRPMHTIIPGMLMKDGQAVAPFGVMGGHYQAMGHVELLSGLLDRGLDVQEALDAPRSFAYGGSLEVEGGISDAVMAGLVERGHPAIRAPLPLGGGQVIWIDRKAGTLAAGSDPRKDGAALGY
ncbi:gamma-glutamyltranspeptidase / glutathione hydrolase [Methylobacterium sp. 275MFSha3.1]|uniref:gamma-glutamyltransferase family protein n=1 Tax=Methylobacterium sp. 275MFSha3.1 TaxID=1502746 RepID=UPI0008A7BED1|nr:gamma-glutamyltransferase family protein [Methylobacterium sp. 275MFSha3.1]SEH26943.1 gamma-glutamyltranspeptidase / glutathione hydrolase [Methylobacterium sp. 275MFSha3.1]